MSSSGLLAKLEREGKLKRQRAEDDHLNGLLEAARRNFSAARYVRKESEEAAFKLYYDGLLQISRVIVLLEGYRPDDGEQHRTTFLAAGEVLGPSFADLIRKIQKCRIKRNDCVYDPKGLVGKSDADSISRTAWEYWSEVRAYLKNTNRRLVLFEDP